MKYIFFLVLFTLSGCLARITVNIPDPELHEIQNEKIIESIMAQATTGDWLVTRGYHATDNLVANATATPITHVAVYNAEKKFVIEAEGKGVHTSSLHDFVNKSYRVLIIRPRWKNDDNKDAAFAKAEQLVGKNYDFLGTIGFNYPNKYYCSELAVEIYKDWHRPIEKFPKVIKPGELYLYGKILYDSLPREEMIVNDGLAQVNK